MQKVLGAIKLYCMQINWTENTSYSHVNLLCKSVCVILVVQPRYCCALYEYQLQSTRDWYTFLYTYISSTWGQSNWRDSLRTSSCISQGHQPLDFTEGCNPTLITIGDVKNFALIHSLASPIICLYGCASGKINIIYMHVGHARVEFLLLLL